jgi:hypothetical protein
MTDRQYRGFGRTLGSINQGGAEEVAIAPDKPTPSSGLKAVIGDGEFNGQQGKAGMKPQADASIGSVSHGQGEKMVQSPDVQESAAIARRPIGHSSFELVFEGKVTQGGHAGPPPVRWPSASMLPRPHNPIIRTEIVRSGWRYPHTRQHRNQDWRLSLIAAEKVKSGTDGNAANGNATNREPVKLAGVAARASQRTCFSGWSRLQPHAQRKCWHSTMQWPQQWTQTWDRP